MAGYTYDYPRPMVSVDVIVFSRGKARQEVLAVRRGKPPFQGMLALPGGFVDMDEDLLDAARRELAEETGLTGVRLHQLAAFGRPGRDPRGRTISIAFVGILENKRKVQGGDDAAEAIWIPARRPPALAFDHAEILGCALAWLRKRSKGS
jgi:8-oxo-dGTP diphosphatase